VFKTEAGAYIYGIMSVIRDGNSEKIEFDRAYWVYDSVMTKAAFDSFEIGKTTRKEVFDYTGQTRMMSEAEATMKFKRYNMTLEEYKSFNKFTDSYARENGTTVEELNENIIKTWKAPTTHSFLTTTGVMTISFKYDETLGEHVVSSMKFTEGCPINPEDLI
ncbi:MAG: hypothetical protein II808_04055, partial [Clostridia bacterium]|nr:hypothetical protein [Clostridia bacterium]